MDLKLTRKTEEFNEESMGSNGNKAMRQTQGLF